MPRLDRSPHRVGVEQQRHHHLRVERRPPPAILPISPVESAQIHLVDGVDDEPGEMILRQPLPQARRQQQLLIARPKGDVTGVTTDVVPAAGLTRTIRPPVSATSRLPVLSATICPGKLKRSRGVATTTTCVRTRLRRPVAPTACTRRTWRPGVSRFE